MSKFLTAEWRHLLMLNYTVQPELLRPYLPAGVELDTWNGYTYVSMVGFLFLKTKVLGLSLPLHTDFEEVNLRFYVRRRGPEGWRRGVVFIKEIVPRQLIATVARVFYNEPYVALPMRHQVDLTNGSLHSGSTVEYSWRHQGTWNSMRAVTIGSPQPMLAGSEEEYIAEHYWGYTAQPGGGCKEYPVEHVRWNVWQVKDAALQCQTASLYGPQFTPILAAPPQSAFVAEGSPVIVNSGTLL